MTEHNEIWLEPAPGADLDGYGRQWCQDNVWGDEAIRYILAPAGEQIRGDEWQSVPKEPTLEMLGAWYRYKNGHHWPDEPPPRDTSDYGAYRAMLAAAPQPSPNKEGE